MPYESVSFTMPVGLFCHARRSLLPHAWDSVDAYCEQILGMNQDTEQLENKIDVLNKGTDSQKCSL
jgi:hypothetical protein